jgi:hypothetical protein
VLDLRQPHWAQGFAALPHDLYFWLALLTGVMAVAQAFHYVRCADRLVALTDSSDFRRRLLAARWAITGFLLDFLVFTVALAQIKPVF